jgi:hypothetical protein
LLVGLFAALDDPRVRQRNDAFANFDADAKCHGTLTDLVWRVKERSYRTVGVSRGSLVTTRLERRQTTVICTVDTEA